MINCRTDYDVIYARKAAKKKRTPKYTYFNLKDELDYYRPRTLILCANGKRVEVSRELILGLLRESGISGDQPARYKLAVPRKGYGVITPDPNYRKRKSPKRKVKAGDRC